MTSLSIYKKRYSLGTLKDGIKSIFKPNIPYTETKGKKKNKIYLTTGSKIEHSFTNAIPKKESSCSQTESSRDYVKLPVIPRQHQSSKVVSNGNYFRQNKVHKTYTCHYTLTNNMSSRASPRNSIDARFRCSVKTLAGQKSNGVEKTNQDSNLLMHNVFKGSFNFVIGVFDGHGIKGHLVSKFLKNFFSQYFLTSECLMQFKKHMNAPLDNKEDFDLEMKKLFAFAEKELIKEDFDSYRSGSTVNLVASFGNTLFCLNTGDSRAIYINDEGNVFQISEDHKPNNKDEKERIYASGGIVLCDDDNVTYRVYFNHQDEPGLALSRSIGDLDSKKAGIISEPDIFELPIIENGIKTVIMASDGLWDCFTNEEVRDLIQPFAEEKNSAKASKALLDKARKSWLEFGTYIDDITIIVLFL